MSRVVHCKRNDYDVYIGRPSIWGNPFHEGRDGTRAEVIARYEKWIKTQPQLMSKLPELRGKVLGCWCYPKPCHGEVLIRLAGHVAHMTGGLTGPVMSHRVPSQSRPTQDERRHDMAPKAKKGSKKVAAKKVVKSRKVVKAVKARKTTKKTLVTAQKTVKRVAAEKGPAKKSKKEFKLKPAIPIESVKSKIARVRIPALIQEIKDHDETIADIMAELGPSLEGIAELRKAAMEELVKVSGDAKIEAVEGDDWRLSYFTGKTTKLDPTKLLALGVSMAVIKKATVETPKKAQVRISKKGEAVQETEE